MTVSEPSVQPRKKRQWTPEQRKAASERAKQRHRGTVNMTATEAAHESPEQRRARLLAELAELNQSQPEQSGPVGPNYWAMNHSTLKTLCISKSIIDRTGQRDGMIQLLQSEDMKLGLAPHPKENATAMSGLRAGNTPVHAEPQNRDSTRIIDSDGNQYAMVYRVGRTINGNPVVLDMENNARKIVAVLNEGRFA